MTGALSASGVASAAVEPEGIHEIGSFVSFVAYGCLIWYIFIILVQIIGTSQLFRFYSSSPAPAYSTKLPRTELPHITVLRPVKGLEPQLYECLAATFRQNYPREKLEIRFCVSSPEDPAYPVLQQLVTDFPEFDAKVLVEQVDPNLSGHDGEANNLGPNPKIRNLSRGYREAKGDIVWIIDCNVWIGKGVAGRMVDKLCGYGRDGTRVKPYKFVHQLPLVVDTAPISQAQSKGVTGNSQDRIVTPGQKEPSGRILNILKNNGFRNAIISGGGRLEEMFMATSHSKFYGAINTVAAAPCIVGKSNMFRRSHLNALTQGSSPYSPGIDFFSDNICEDHLIGDLLWRKKVPEEQAGEKWGKHGLVFGDMAIQPMAGMSVPEFIARRVRWLRVRKWTVTVATFIEPGVECFLCSAYGAFAITTLPWFHQTLGIPQTWATFRILWIINVLCWLTVDRFVYAKLHSCASVEIDENTPSFARPPPGLRRRPFKEWIAAWIARECLTLPIWVTAFFGGTTVVWRSKQFWVGMDMKVHEIKDETHKVANGIVTSKHRHD